MSISEKDIFIITVLINWIAIISIKSTQISKIRIAQDPIGPAADYGPDTRGNTVVLEPKTYRYLYLATLYETNLIDQKRYNPLNIL